MRPKKGRGQKHQIALVVSRIWPLVAHVLRPDDGGVAAPRAGRRSPQGCRRQ